MFARTLKPILLGGLVAASIDIRRPPGRCYIPDMKATAEGTTDGTDLPVSGPTVPPGGPARLRSG